jgi:hypothetical protein
LSQGSVDRDSGTEERRGGNAGESFWNLQGMTRGSLHELRVSAVHGDAGDLLFDAEILIAFAAELAFAASPMHPRNTYAVADLQVIDRGAFLYHATGDFVPEDQGFLRDRNELRPIPIRHMQVRVADAARFHLDQNIVYSRLWLIDLFYAQRRFEFAQDGGFHRVNLNESGMRDSDLIRQACEFLGLSLKMEFPRTAYGLAPRKKNSTALRTRSVSL